MRRQQQIASSESTSTGLIKALPIQIRSGQYCVEAMTKFQDDKAAGTIEVLEAPTPWPGANARLLGLGLGLPVAPLDRLANFSAADFERFTLEWAAGYPPVKAPRIVEV